MFPSLEDPMFPYCWSVAVYFMVSGIFWLSDACIHWCPGDIRIITPRAMWCFKKIICRTFEGELGLQLIFFKLKKSFNQDEEENCLSGTLQLKVKKCLESLKTLVWKHFLVFSSAKGKGALSQNTMTVLENSSLYGLGDTGNIDVGREIGLWKSCLI